MTQQEEHRESPWGIPVPEDYAEQYTVFYEGCGGPYDGILIPSMLGWTDQTRAIEFRDYVVERDVEVVNNGGEALGSPILVHRTGAQSWERVENG